MGQSGNGHDRGKFMLIFISICEVLAYSYRCNNSNYHFLQFEF